jgi:ubiquinol-cytochrome c reductase cytochrome b subunit
MIWRWLDDRIGLTATVLPLVTHAVPRSVGWWYVFGSATLLAFGIQVFSGVVLAFSYIPSASQAYDTLQFISTQTPFGHFMRGLHYYGASAMILLVGLHAVRVFLFGSYKYPREMNWITGVLLLGFTVLMGFTGQLLRWDQTAVWSVVVAAEQAGRVPILGPYLARFLLGGQSVGGATLSRFFAIHVFLIPACLFGFIGLHLVLVLRHGISEPPKAGAPVDPMTYRGQYEEALRTSGRPFWPDAAWRDVLFGAAVIAVVAGLALAVGAPRLGRPPDPSIVAADPRPDWYLLWYFAVLALLPPYLENYVIVLAPLAAGVVMLGLPLVFNRGERHPARRPWSMAVVLMVVIMVGALWIEGAQSPWSPDFAAPVLSADVVGVTSGPVAEGARLFHEKGCENCHTIDGFGGRRGPELSTVADRLTPTDMIIRIANGGVNMPAFAGILRPDEVDRLVAFLETRRRPNPDSAAASGRPADVEGKER